MDFLTADSLPWLAAAAAQIRRAAAAGRLPHSLLILSGPGLGDAHLAAWSIAFALCEERGRAPCGACPACLLVRADSHPDVHVVRLEEDAQQIKVDQVRALIDDLAQTSYRGGYKIGLIEGAERLNANGANAFLKTLEEPTQETMLILTARPSHRLPATVASRCLRIVLRAPQPALARAWLRAQSPSAGDFDAALALAGGAPLLAAELAAEGMATLETDMQRSVGQLAAGSVDITVLAERWSKSDPLLRVRWLENWITARIVGGLAGAAGVGTAEPVGLPGALLKAKIRELFALLDAATEFRRLASTSMNQQLALEALLLGGRRALWK
ncbi:MAG TPA: hypothetical protein VMV25_08425 [Steroidobacteraceae bacterium]|nr:hypothetical protein [Steroidobacteraceae bacterium]